MEDVVKSYKNCGAGVLTGGCTRGAVFVVTFKSLHTVNPLRGID